MITSSNCFRRKDRPLALLTVAVMLAACDGNGGGYGSEPPPPPADTTAPTVAVTVPASAVSRSVTLTGTATDNVAVTQVEFFVDGVSIGVDMSAPYSVTWNSGNATDGSHAITARASDAAGNAATSTAGNVTVRNSQSFSVALSGLQEWPAAATSGATGTAELTVNLATGALSGGLTTTGMTTTAAHVHEAFAGRNGPVIVGLALDTATNRWVVPANTSLTTAQVDTLLRGGLYVNAHSATHPNGEARGQIEPDHVDVHFATLSSGEVVEPATSRGAGRAALTVNRDTRAVVAHVTTSGLGTVSGVRLRQGLAGVTGAEVLSLTQDTADGTHWFTDTGTLTVAAAAALAAGGLYVNVETEARPNGELRGQVLPPNVVVGFARLQGLQEVPATDSSAIGTGAVTVDRDAMRATIHLRTRDLDGATAAHLHGSYGGRNGGILIGLTQDGSDPAHWSATDQPITAEALAALVNGATYLNAHTPAHPGGEIRGQVLTPGVLFIVGRLGGSEEVPVRDTDAAGTVAVTIVRASRDLVLHANTSGVDDAVAAHVHLGYAGANGPVEIGLTRDPVDPTHWTVDGVRLDELQLAAIERGGAYVNVHTPQYPGGEIRGQLVSDDVRVVFTSMTGSEEVPPVATEARGQAATTVDLATRKVTVHVRTTGIDDAVAAYVQRGARGTDGPILIPLAAEAGNPQHWLAVEQTVADGDIADFLAALWYVNVHTPANPDGEIRGQIGLEALPPPDTSAPTVTISAPAGTVSGTVMLYASAQDDVGVTSVRFLANGNVIGEDATAPYSINWDTTTVANGVVHLTADARDAAGNVGQSGSLMVTVDNVVATTLTELQNTIFTPRCSGCHTGGGGGLPSTLNLSNRAASFAALVNVAAVQRPALLRVAPNDPEGSYLVRKLAGGPDIDGARMPFGGPFLSAGEMDAVRSWINSGAPNN